MASIAGTNQTVISLAFQNMQGPILDNIFQQIPLLDYLRKQGNVKMFNGGERLTFAVMHASNSTAGSYSKYGTIDTTPQEGFGSVEYAWRQYAVSISVAGLELRQVSGEWAIANLLESKSMQAEMSLADVINQHLFTAQSGNNLEGLPTLVANDPTAAATVGGIPQATNTWWQNQYENGASASAAFDMVLKDMRTVYNKCTAASKKFGPPKLIVTTRAIFEVYEGLVDSQRHYGNEQLLNLGFDNLAFKQAGMVFDNDAPAATTYFINPKTLFLGFHPEAFFTTTDFVKPGNQDALVGQILAQFNLCSTNRSTNGVIHSIT